MARNSKSITHTHKVGKNKQQVKENDKNHESSIFTYKSHIFAQS